MNAADLLARAERRAATVRVSATVVKWAGALALALALYCTGERAGRAQSSAAVLHAKLDTNAHQVGAAKAHQDTVHHAAVALTRHVDATRRIARALEQRVDIVDSTTVRLHLVDSLATVALPPLVVAELAADRAQIRDDSIAINLWIANDSAHLEIERRLDERTQLLEGAVKTESRAALRRGEKIGAAVVTVVVVVLHFVLR